MNDFELGWLVGILEGEGSFYTVRNRGNWYVRISLESCDEDVARHAATLLGGEIYGPKTRKDRPKNKPRWIVRLNYSAAASMMRELEPFMSDRRAGQIRNALTQAGR